MQQTTYELIIHESHSSLVSIVTRLGAGQLGLNHDRKKESIFLVAIASRPALGTTQPCIQKVPGVKWLGHEADHSLPSSAKVKNV
jgi:hypothetical protein